MSFTPVLKGETLNIRILINSPLEFRDKLIFFVWTKKLNLFLNLDLIDLKSSTFAKNINTHPMIAQRFDTHRLVKSEDLNHHGTLFAGRTAEWFVESGFIGISSYLNPKNIVCLKIHGMEFKFPVRGGETIKLSSKLVYTGKSSLIVHVRVLRAKDSLNLVEGFISFVHVDDSTKPQAHGLSLDFESEEDKVLYAKASMLKK